MGDETERGSATGPREAEPNRPTGAGVQPAAWLAPLAAAYERPWEVAERWRRDGGRVVGLLGQSAPRELVSAAGMLALRLRPAALAPDPERRRMLLQSLPAGLASEIDPDVSLVLAALLRGELKWIDGLLIGRENESHTKLFYVLREMACELDAPPLPWFAFADLLRLPARISARYNRVRLRELRDQLADFSGRAVGDAEITAAVEDERLTAAALAPLAAYRSEGRIRGSEMLVAIGASQVLPGADARAALAGCEPAAAGPRDQGQRSGAGPGRLFITGSGLDSPMIYEQLEAAGALVAGEDHQWGQGAARPSVTRDPIDGLADHYQFGIAGSSRAGLDRAAVSAASARELRADAVLQLVLEHDQASGWELPGLRAQLPGTPVITAALSYADPDPGTVSAVLDQLAPTAGAGAADD